MKQWKKQFITLWTGQAVSIFTSAVVQMSLIWYITDKTESAAMLTLATLVGFLPRAIIGAIGGVYIDRYSKKLVMLLADGWIAVVSLALVIVGETVDIPLWLIFVILFGRSVGAAFHEPSLQAATPLIVPRENLTQYAGYAQSFQSISDLLSPAAASVLFAAFPIHRIILIDIIGAAFAMSMLAFIKLPTLPKTIRTERQRFLPEFKAGLVALRDAKGMTLLMAACAVYSIIYSPIGTMFPLVSMSHFGAGVKGSAVVETAFAVGTLAGSFLLGMLGSKIKKVPAIAASIGLYGLGTLITGLLPRSGFVFFVIISVFMGISIPFYHGVRTAMLQMSFPAELLGRIMALSMSIMRFAMPVGLILAGAFAETIGVDTWFAISGILAMVLAFVIVRSPSLKGCCE
ncbi:MFS transporter [Eubacteriales bacterium OttesenSCG-928-A19]|nr:MFS transporter [Eubacteriales bacterium OttesenSCG-928-A19]